MRGSLKKKRQPKQAEQKGVYILCPRSNMK